MLRFTAQNYSFSMSVVVLHHVAVVVTCLWQAGTWECAMTNLFFDFWAVKAATFKSTRVYISGFSGRGRRFWSDRN